MDNETCELAPAPIAANNWIQQVALLCAACGSFRCRWTIEFRATMMPFAASLGAKGHSPGAKKPFVEFFTGSDWWKAMNKWARKNRTIDRRFDQYYEEVIDADSGQVIRKCEEPLSKHVFHGSAKPKP